MKRKIKAKMDRCKEVNGLRVGQRIQLKLGGHAGTIIGFSRWGDNSLTVFTKLDDLPGNHGDHHCCGDAWVEPIASLPLAPAS